MIVLIKQLLLPLNYLRIRNSAKRQFDFVLPAILGSIISAVVLCMPGPVKIFGDGGYVEIITGLLQILTGFYIAALAAVATFPNITLDQPFDGEPAMLAVLRKGQKKDISLSRRRFLSFLFGYLAFLAIFLYLLGGMASLLADNIKSVVDQAYQPWLKGGFVVVFTILFANLLIVTMLGLHYLTDRIQRPPSGNQAGTGHQPTSPGSGDGEPF